MKHFIFIFLLLSSYYGYAQNYHVMYRYNVESDINAAMQDAHAKGIDIQKTGSLTEQEKEYKYRFAKEMWRDVSNRKTVSGICTPEGQSFEVVMVPRKDDSAGKYNFYQSAARYINVLDYEHQLHAYITKVGGLPNVVYHRLGEAASLTATGKKRAINGRMCNGYIAVENHLTGVVFWADPSLPNYIYPEGFVVTGAEGGIAAMSFEGDKFTIALEEIKEVKAGVEALPYTRQGKPQSAEEVLQKVTVTFIPMEDNFKFLTRK